MSTPIDNVLPASSLFLALRDDNPYVYDGMACILQATTARTVVVLYQLGCNLDTTHYGRTLFRKCWDYFELTGGSDEMLAKLIHLGATWHDPDDEKSADAVVADMVTHDYYRALEELLQSGRVDAESTTMWDKWLIEALPDPAKGAVFKVMRRSSNPEYDFCDCLRLLLEYGGNPNARDADGKSLLQRLTRRVCNVTALELLLRHGADPNELLANEDCGRHAKHIDWASSSSRKDDVSDVRHDLEFTDREALSSRKRRRSSGCEEPATAARLGFPHRHDNEDNCNSDVDGKWADDERADESVDEGDDEGVNGMIDEEQMQHPIFVWLRSQEVSHTYSMGCHHGVWWSVRQYPQFHRIIKAFLSAPTFDPLIVSSNNTTLFAAVCETGDAELVEMYFRVAERRGILIDVNARSHQVPISLLDRSGNVLPSLLQRGLSLDGSFVFTETKATKRFNLFSIRGQPDHRYNRRILKDFANPSENVLDVGAPQRYDVPLLLAKRRGEMKMSLFPILPHFEGACLAVPRELKSFFIDATIGEEPPYALHTACEGRFAGRRWSTEEYWVCAHLRGQQYCFSAPSSFLSVFQRRSVRETFITWALLQSAPPAVHALLKVPTVDVDTPNGRGMYPLHIAAQMHGKYTLDEETGAYHESFVGVFRRCRHVDVVNDEGNNVLHHLAVWGSGDRLGYCLGDSTVTLLEDADNDNDTDDDDATAVDTEDVRRKQAVLRSLINRPNHAGHTPLTLVLALGYWDIAPLLMRHGADATRLASCNLLPLSTEGRFNQRPEVHWDHDVVVPPDETSWYRGEEEEEEEEDDRCSHCTRRRQPAVEGRNLGIALIGHRTQIRVNTRVPNDIKVRERDTYPYY